TEEFGGERTQNGPVNMWFNSFDVFDPEFCCIFSKWIFLVHVTSHGIELIELQKIGETCLGNGQMGRYLKDAEFRSRASPDPLRNKVFFDGKMSQSQLTCPF